MQTVFLPKRQIYDGSQLRSHFIFDSTGAVGDACLAFIGGCDVSFEHMVDLADKRDRCAIYGKEMLHFIIEHFGGTLEGAILRQRLFVSIAADALREHGVKGLARRGNDIYDGRAKLNVSIATVSPVSTLVHVGINILSKGTPVETKGLKDYGIEPRAFAEKMMKRYKEECEGVAAAGCKVRGVM